MKCDLTCFFNDYGCFNDDWKRKSYVYGSIKRTARLKHGYQYQIIAVWNAAEQGHINNKIDLTVATQFGLRQVISLGCSQSNRTSVVSDPRWSHGDTMGYDRSKVASHTRSSICKTYPALVRTNAIRFVMSNQPTKYLYNLFLLMIDISPAFLCHLNHGMAFFSREQSNGGTQFGL